MNEENYKELFELIKNFVKSYQNKLQNISDELWLNEMLAAYLPAESPENISAKSQEILANVSTFNETFDAACAARTDGEKPYEWVADRINAAAVNLSSQEYAETIAKLYSAYEQANQEMLKTILKQDGSINMNPHLDGFIAETAYANKFNRDAILNNSAEGAEVLRRPEGGVYEKNSPDVRFFDRNTNATTGLGQLKFGKDSAATEKMILAGDYKNEKIIVPAEQYEALKNSPALQGYDIENSGLTKTEMENLRDNAQSGENIFESSALDLGKQIAFAGAAGAALGAGIHVLGKILSSEKIEADEVIESALRSGADAGIKAAVGGALQIAAEKKIIPAVLGQGISKIAGPVVEGIKIFGDLATGEIDGKEAVTRFMWLGASTFATDMILGGVSLAGIGSTLMGALPLVFSPVGIAAGLAVGALAFGSEICDFIGSAVNTVGEIVTGIWDGLTSAAESVIDFFFG